MKKHHSQLWQSPWTWSCGGLISIIMIVSGTVNLEFQGQFIPISLRPILRMVEVYVMAVVWSPCSYLLQPVGVSVSLRRLTGYASMVSIALEKELKVLARWLNYYFVLFDCFPLLLHFLTSLIKLVVWLTFFHRQKASRRHGEWGP